MYNEKQICKPFGSTVAEKALAFSLILGCNPIILHGVDLPEKIIHHNYYSDNYADQIMKKVSSRNQKIKQKILYKKSLFSEYLKEIKNKIRSIKKKKDYLRINKEKNTKKFPNII